MFFALINLYVYLTFIKSGESQKWLNDTCVLQNGKSGRCIRYEHCESAIELVRNWGCAPLTCSFEGRHPLVCCEVKPQLRQKLVRKAGEISKEKCREYYMSVPALTTTTTTTESIEYPDDITFEELLAIAEKQADKLRAEGKSTITVHTTVVGGRNAEPQEFLHMAVLGYGERDDITWGCGASLISEKFVLTAAHCIRTKIGSVKFVRVGDLDLNSTTDDARPQNFDVLKWTIHPKYRSPSVYNDIAIIELSANVIIDKYVRPGCLFAGTDIPSTDLSATGWGVTKFQGVQANHLQDVLLNHISFETCRDAYKSESKRRLPNGIANDTHLCAGDDGKDTCQGDSGGPLQIKNAEFVRGFSIIGVTSFGKACGIGRSVAVYTRVSHYIEWIESIVWPDS